jgi:hypothetical protein
MLGNLFFVYRPSVLLFILLSSVISLSIVLRSVDIKSICSPLMDRVPVKPTALLLIVLVLYTLGKVIADIYGFEFNERINLAILFYISLVRAFFITMKVILILSAAVLLLRQRYVGYFLSYLILMTIALTWLGNTLTINPLHLFPGINGVVNAAIQWHLTRYDLLPLFFSTLLNIFSFILALVFIINSRGTGEKTGE